MAMKRHPANVGRGTTAGGVGAYSKSTATIKRDPRIDDSGNYRDKRPRDHSRDIEGVAARTERTVAPVTGAPGLSASLPRGVSYSGGGLTRPVSRPRPKRYLG
jgi:hypothetical protein